MSKAVSFFFAPVTAFFLPQVYRDAVKSPARKGLFYTAYWSLLVTVFIMAVFLDRLSISDKFMAWVKNEAPVVIWTPEGLSLENGQKKAALTHPVYGPIAVFDMTRTTETAGDLGQLYILVTARKIFFNKPVGPAEERDITKAGVRPGQKLPSKVRVTGELIEKFYRRAKSACMAMAPFILFPGFFLIFMAGNLFYSLAGLLFNLTRKNRLGYGAVFNLMCFAAGVSLPPLCIRIIYPLPWLVPRRGYCSAWVTCSQRSS